MIHAHLPIPIGRLARALAAAAALSLAADAAAQPTRRGPDPTVPVAPAAADTTPGTAATTTTSDDTATTAAGAAATRTDAAGATAGAANPRSSRTDTTAAAVPRVDSLLTARARMGGLIRMRTSGVDQWAKTATNDPKTLVLYLDGRAMKGAVAQRVSGAGRPETWEVRLRRGDDARDAWEAVLGSPNRFVRNVRVGLGPAAGPEFAAAADSVLSLRLVVAPRGWLWLPALAWLALIAGFFYLAATTGIIRDSPAPIPPPTGDAPPPPVPAARSANPRVAAREAGRERRKERLALRPYSMARTQMAFWFLLVTTAFLAIWIVTGDTRGVITTQAVFLIGLGAGTALAAGMVESNKREEQAAAAERMQALDARRRELVVAKASRGPLAPPSAVDDEMLEVAAANAALLNDTPDAPASKGFFRDVLSDQGGPALHRYQHFVWTLIVGAIFVLGAYRTLALPEIDDTMLLLMGISAATYVGFKTREDQT